MEAKNLRIGNLIYNESNEPCFISQLLSDKKIRYEGYEGEDWQFEHIGADENIYLSSVINPIPITEEWLIKFGFDLVVKEGNQGEFRVYQLNEITYNTNHGWWWKHQLTVQPKYVHELQNLFFALTGKELSIENVK